MRDSRMLRDEVSVSVLEVGWVVVVGLMGASRDGGGIETC